MCSQYTVCVNTVLLFCVTGFLHNLKLTPKSSILFSKSYQHAATVPSGCDWTIFRIQTYFPLETCVKENGAISREYGLHAEALSTNYVF